MKKLIIVVLLSLPGFSLASEHVKLDKANIDPTNKASLQRGFKYFVNYCMGCHGLAYSRYNRVAKDLGIPKDLMLKNAVFTRDEKGEKTKIGANIEIAMPTLYAKQAFGNPPPDLSLIGRSRGADWLYSYLRGFYLDDSRPFGVNNTVFPDVGMPHVLWELQGYAAKSGGHEGEGEHGGAKHGESEMKIVVPGSMTPAEYDRAVRDLVNFLEYEGEPAKQTRLSLGLPVLLWTLLFTIVAYFMKKEFWKDVH